MMFGVFLTIGLAGWGIVELFDRADDADDDSSESASGTDDQTLRGTDQAERIEGGDGDDTISGQGGSDTLIGGEGEDTLEGGDRQDILFGGEGDDSLSGDRDADFLVGNAGDDTLDGGNWDDILAGGAGKDLLKGGAGDDVLVGGFLDQEAGGDATDLTPELWEELKGDLTSGASDLTAALNGGAETIADALDVPDAKVQSDSDGADTLIGGEGDDTLGLKGGDVAWGDEDDGKGGGNDTFMLDLREAGDHAFIQDFVKGEDTIVLEYEKGSTPPTVTVDQDAETVTIFANGEEIAVLDNPQGGVVRSSDIVLTPSRFV